MSDGKGIIGRIQVDGYPVVYKLVDEAPSDTTRANFPWLTVIGWEFDGSANNGMPEGALMEQMDALERNLETVIDSGHCVHAYSRTGNGLKELVYYAGDRDAFTAELNDALRSQPRYPISINFYKDASWEDFGKVRALFRGAPRRQG